LCRIESNDFVNMSSFNSEPLISIIVPNYNHGLYLTDRIQSVLNQEYPNFELILLDDCSTDNSREIIKGHRDNPKVSAIVFNTLNSGNTFSQWQLGLTHCKGEFVWIAESDDLSESTFLSKAVSALSSHLEKDAVVFDSIIIDEKGEVKYRFSELKSQDLPSSAIRSLLSEQETFAAEMFFRNRVPNASAVLIKKEKLLQLISYTDRYKLCGDWNIWLKLILEDRLFFVNEALNLYRQHPNTARHKKAHLFVHEQLQVINSNKANFSKFNLIQSELTYYICHKMLNELKSHSLKEKFLLLKELKKVNPAANWIFTKSLLHARIKRK
jgi:glycosyltransferase involved in cell wall biosynthesis